MAFADDLAPAASREAVCEKTACTSPLACTAVEPLGQATLCSGGDGAGARCTTAGCSCTGGVTSIDGCSDGAWVSSDSSGVSASAGTFVRLAASGSSESSSESGNTLSWLLPCCGPTQLRAWAALPA